MNRLIWIVSGILLATLLGWAQQTGQWMKFHSPKCRFSVDFPSSPSVKEPDDATSLFGAQNNSADYVLMCSIFPRELGLRGKEYLEDSANSSIKGMGVNGRMLDKKEITVQGFPALSYTARGIVDGQDQVIYVQSILAGRYHYMLTVITHPKRVQVKMKEDVDRFFSSFIIDNSR